MVRLLDLFTLSEVYDKAIPYLRTSFFYAQRGSVCLLDVVFRIGSYRVGEFVHEVLALVIFYSPMKVFCLIKSAIFFSASIPQDNKGAMEELLGFRMVNQFKKYLGMPTLIDCSNKPIFVEVLIKSIAQSIPIYIMSCFSLLTFFCNEMRSIIAKFWWSGIDDQKKISWVSWNAICKPKKEGGLGFRNLCAFNLAILAKQAWKLTQNPRSLCARVLKGIAWRIGDGNSVDVMTDNLITSASYMKPVGVLNVPEGCKVNYFLKSNATWNREKIHACFLTANASNILKIPISRNLPPDKIFWPLNKNGFYSVKPGYY
ncbi:uncharacterized protein LOC126661649 [Mercurialis annua]|uniref:uncharacterized protein LOC126661649 n=1 Tax=Mercurialis annua TaxID=3986 RepID=UPI00215F493B|nr:uncharacterized protein LOC126661649 [Mercurialis annua]